MHVLHVNLFLSDILSDKLAALSRQRNLVALPNRSAPTALLYCDPELHQVCCGEGPFYTCHAGCSMQ